MPELEYVEQHYIARTFFKKIVCRKFFESRMKFYELMLNRTLKCDPPVFYHIYLSRIAMNKLTCSRKMAKRHQLQN